MELSILAALKAKRLRRAERGSEDPLTQDDLDNRLLDAASLGRDADVARWIAMGADANARDTAGFTALMSAAFAGSMQCVQVLLPLSRTFERDSGGRNAVDLASKSGYQEVALAIEAFESSRRESVEIERECSPALPRRRFKPL